MQAGQTPLHWAAARDHLPCVQLLVEKGASVNAKVQVNQGTHEGVAWRHRLFALRLFGCV
jgi:ankyrin repeat protein